MMNMLRLLLATLFFPALVQAQVMVSTLTDDINASGGITRNAVGDIFVSDFGPGNTIDSNTLVYRIDKDDLSISVFSDGFIGASGACFDSQGNFYQSNPAGNRVSKISADGTKELDWVTTGLNVPIGIIADAQDDLYVCSCGDNNVSKITADGEISVFSTSSHFSCPNGLTIDPEGNLYIANYRDGRIIRLAPDGSDSLIAELPMLTGGPFTVGNGHITYANGALFVAQIGSGQIFRLCLDGKNQSIAGVPFAFTNVDGPGALASFSKPNGIAASITGDTLFINGAEASWPNDPLSVHPGNIRMITGILSLDESFCAVELPLFSEITQGPIISQTTLSLGGSWADYNKDGFVDLFVAVGSGNNKLYKNNGDLTFSPVSNALSTNGGSSSSAIWGDYNNDGYVDLYVSNNPSPPSSAQTNFLYQNNGPPNFDFTAITNDAPTQAANYTWSSSWVDYDLDGDLDLHVPENRHLHKDFFFENQGAPNAQGQYFVQQLPSFISDEVESTGVASWIDYDNDCDQDLFLLKSGRSHPNGVEDHRMYHSNLRENGQLEFKRVLGAEMVSHLDLDFQASWGDYDNDGDMDVYLGNFDGPNYLYRNEGDSLFTRILTGAVVEDDRTSLGSSWGDFNNDGDLDLFVGSSSGEQSVYYENDGLGNLSPQDAAKIGPPLVNASNTQSVASADVNNDGYLDLFLANSAFGPSQLAPDFLYLNNGGDNNYMLLRLEGTASNRSAIGAKVRIKATINGTPVWQMRVVSGSPTGDRAQNSQRIHFGLGDAIFIDTMIIEWPSCQRSVFSFIEANQNCEIIEGSSTTCILDGNVSTQQPFSALTSFRIHPNPALGSSVYIRYELSLSQQLITFSLLDTQGRLVSSYERPNTGEAQLDVGAIPAGLYYLKLVTKDGVATRKLVIQ
ncbi:MAG: FG-GAP-like repeat-containing protein [Bacteroidota bacterium]